MNATQKSFVIGVVVGVVAYYFYCQMQASKAPAAPVRRVA